MDILWWLIVSFTIFTALLIPTFKFYYEGSGYQNVQENMQGNEIYSLGNMGYSSVKCS